MKLTLQRMFLFSVCAMLVACSSTKNTNGASSGSGSGSFTLTITPAANGTITASPVKATYAQGEVVQLAATPIAGYTLTTWQGTDDDGSAALTNSITMTANSAVTATFVATSSATFMLSLNAVTNGTLAAGPVGPSYALGTDVTLTATPNSGFKVATWTGTEDDTSTSTTNHVILSANKTVGVTFVAVTAATFTLTLTPTSANGTLTASPTQATYTDGTAVTLTATPVGGFKVATWTGTSNDGSTSPINHVTMTANRAVTVAFTGVTAATHTLTLNAGANGTLSANPVGPTFTDGDVVALTATPASSSFKVGTWTNSDNDPGTNLASNQVTMTANKTVSVSFVPSGTTYTLTLLTPDNWGTITAATAGPYPANTVVNLTAAPDSNYFIFGCWKGTDDDTKDANYPSTGNPSGGATYTSASSTNTITMTSNKTVRACFPECQGHPGSGPCTYMLGSCTCP